VLSIVRVLAPNPGVYTLEGTNTWVVGRDPSIVIDPGPHIASHLDEVGRAAGTVAAVLVTHDHEDHAPGAPAFAARVGAPFFAFRSDGASQLRDGQRFAGGDGVEVVVEHTPGHSSDHVAFFEPSERALFTGDAVVGRGTSFIDPPDGNMTQYLRSLQRMQDLHPRTIYPGHGPIVLDAHAKLDEYTAHREDRERQVLEGLGGGAKRAIADLVATIYAAYPSEVHPLAARSVLAHLLKLEGEGRVARTGKGDAALWTVIGPRACERCGRPVKGRARLCVPCSLALLQDTEGAGREAGGLRD
jgi:glyoxylase-like metal-dependent hydrolase (beta-lactamase superfamily II)